VGKRWSGNVLVNVRLEPFLDCGWGWRIVDKTAVSVENYGELWIKSGFTGLDGVFYVDKFVDNGGNGRSLAKKKQSTANRKQSTENESRLPSNSHKKIRSFTQITA